jgi:hypothetical protein
MGLVNLIKTQIYTCLKCQGEISLYYHCTLKIMDRKAEQIISEGYVPVGGGKA